MFITTHPIVDPRAAPVSAELVLGGTSPTPAPTLGGHRTLSTSLPVPEVPGTFGQYALGHPAHEVLPAIPPSGGGGPRVPT